MQPAPFPVSPVEVLAGKYRIERLLGMGGMGVVVAALLPVRRRFLAPLSASPFGTNIIRAVFATIPAVSFLALADDLRALY